MERTPSAAIKEVAARFAAVRKVGGCAACLGAHVDALQAAMVPGPAQVVAQRAINGRPRAHHPRLANLVDQPIGVIPADIVVGRHAQSVVKDKIEPAHELVQRWVRADAGAAAGEVLGGALKHIDLPADPAKRVRGEHPPTEPSMINALRVAIAAPRPSW